jgi:hypothetical protein
MIFAAVAGLVFGMADQYLGSLRPMLVLGTWTIPVSQMSALWLLVPFLMGSRQRSPGRAAVAGLVATVFGLLGYALMTASPIETVPVHEAPHAVAAWASSNLLVIVGGLVTGPLFGYLGHQWRAARSWVSVGLLAGAFLFEPLARALAGHLLAPTWIWAAESALGLALGAAFVAARQRPSRMA